LDPDPHSSPVISVLLLLQPELAVDPVSLGVQLLTLFLLLLASAFFSGSEVALFSLDHSHKEDLADAGDTASQRVLRLLQHPRPLLITILVLNTVVNVAAAILSAVMIHGIAVAQGWSPTLTIILEVLILTFIILVLAEITPKLIATRHAVEYSRRASLVLSPLYSLLTPITFPLSRSLNAVHRRFKTNGHQRLSAEDLKAMADIGEMHGTLEEEEAELIHSIVEFGETTVREIMVSRLDIVALPVTATLEEALGVIRESGHSRLPLFVDHLDNILGIVYAKDLLPYLTELDRDQRLDWTRISRSPMFIPLGKKLDDLLHDFQQKKTHIAIVVDEYGGTAGLVTMEDVLEEIVGDIRDEHDEAEEAMFERIDERTYRFDARINLDEMSEILDLKIDTEEFDFETLGGLVFHLAGDIPRPGDELVFEAIRLKVESTTNHRIGFVIVEKMETGTPESAGITERNE
jgi:putative hemolysin